VLSLRINPETPLFVANEAGQNSPDSERGDHDKFRVHMRAGRANSIKLFGNRNNYDPSAGQTQGESGEDRG
jgi:hypothetical protein